MTKQIIAIFVFVLSIFALGGVSAAVQLARYLLLRFRGTRTTATITGIARKIYSDGDASVKTRYAAAVEWYDEDGRSCSEIIITDSSRLLSRHFAPFEFGEEKQSIENIRLYEDIYYNKRRAMFANARIELIWAILRLLIAAAFGVFAAVAIVSFHFQ